MSEDFLAKVVIEGEDRSASAALKKTATSAESAGTAFKKLNEPIEGVRSAMNALGVGSNTAAGAMGQLAQGFAAVGGKAGLVGAGITAAAFAINEFVEYSRKIDTADKQLAALNGTFGVTSEDVAQATTAWSQYGDELDRSAVQKLIATGREAGLSTAEITALGDEAKRASDLAGTSFEEGFVKAISKVKSEARSAAEEIEKMAAASEQRRAVEFSGESEAKRRDLAAKTSKEITEKRAEVRRIEREISDTRNGGGTIEGKGERVRQLEAEKSALSESIGNLREQQSKAEALLAKEKGFTLAKEERAARAESLAEEAEAYKRSVELAKKAADEKAEIAQVAWDADIERIREKAKLEKIASDADYENKYGIRNALDEQFAKFDADAKKKAADDLKERTRLEKDAAKESARAHKEALRQREEETRQAAANIVSIAQASAQAIGALKSKDSSTGQKLGAVLGLAGTIASVIPGGQIAGAALLGGGAIASQFHAGGRVTAHAGQYLRGGRDGTVPVSALEGEGVVAREDMALLGGSSAPRRIRELARSGGGASVSLNNVTVNVAGSGPAHRDQAVRLLREAFAPALKGAISAEEKRLASLVGARASR